MAATKKSSLAPLLASKPVFNQGGLLVHSAAVSSANAKPKAQISCLVPKKVLPSAVARNRAKRVARALAKELSTPTQVQVLVRFKASKPAVKFNPFSQAYRARLIAALRGAKLLPVVSAS